MFISNAYAQATSATAPDAIMGYLPLVVIFLVFYFLFIRPQNKRMKEHAALVADLKRGDKVVTDSGIYGEITKVVDDAIVEVQVAEGVKIKVVRHSVSAVLNAAADVVKEAKTSKKSDK